MTLGEALTLVRPIEFIQPGPQAREVLKRATGQRRQNLSGLAVHDGKCVWCNSSPIIPPRKRYCSDKCPQSGLMFCNPQNPDVKAWLLVQMQGGACSFCGIDWEDELVKRIQDWYRHNEHRKQYFNGNDKFQDTRVTYFQIGYGTGELWEVDHIVPIHKGGMGVGFDNVQVICKACHRSKTALDRVNNYSPSVKL